ncbi:MAG: hypothetical protein QOF12_2443 [Solirubrobacteraceae bacterium]|nr:hypothetical protein [Solirubrobacteraceae bacterium]
MLFWAEGSKCRNAVRFTNSDADMLRTFVAFLRRCYGVASERITLTVNCYLNNGLSIDEIHRWWLDKLELPQSSIRTPAIGRASRASRFRRNTLVYGTARVAVHSTVIVQSIFGAIQEYAAIERPEWIDCTPPHRVRAERPTHIDRITPPSTASHCPVM